jgi:hypothetical protein
MRAAAANAPKQVNAGDFMKRDLKRRMDLYENDPYALGIPEEEQQEMRSAALTEDRVNRQAQANQIAQAALAGQGFQQGAFAEAQTELAEGGEQAAASISSQIAAQHQAKMLSEQDRLMVDAQNQRALADAQRRFWAGLVTETGGGIIKAITGGM